MKDSIALRYANALFLLAKEENKVQQYQDEIKNILIVIEQNPDFLIFIKHYNVDKAPKKKLINDVFKGLQENIINYFKLLVDKNRANYLKESLLAFNTLCNEDKGVKEGIIYSISPLTKEEKLKIELLIGQKLKSKVELENKIDRSLLGGIKVVVNDVIFDNTLYRQIQTMHQELLKGKDGD